MKICNTVAELREALQLARNTGRRIGFVPTMGALHQGHLSLVNKSVATCDVSVASIFVNPTQFGPNEDLDKYPRTLELDSEILEDTACDVLFVPTDDSLYPTGFGTWVIPASTEADDIMCGAHRPLHFRGVLTVVAKLFNIVQPEIAFFGQKDFQQAWLIRRMVRDLDFPVEIAILPTIREADGLALSSRNRYLSPSQREVALVLHRALETGRQQIVAGERATAALRESVLQVLAEEPGFQLEYVDLRETESLKSVGAVLKGEIVIALAGQVGETRLIDNMLVQVPVLMTAPAEGGVAHVS